MVLYEEKVKENQQLKDKLDQIQQIQTAMLAYVLSQSQGFPFGGQPKKDTPNPNFLLSLMSGGLPKINPLALLT